ncbi:hypothetical protein CEUSTIGMA_g9280.t1 [Chlamydomonas eustigma]|uniref:Era-type G domain-containing protein n=1 Tax=Chlamydomonas eustigma TaxID=1157962 RepID=A0A250XG08_9CHLO|nr:hypothetical protein CEUSTIGMA_g9280.t1 [Chlamydomonas eustigma]|eukprot:GAX81852.1 hypothetical protein CEUSTIGMA_g9280.t1 [Chlamydomonas eustigma]
MSCYARLFDEEAGPGPGSLRSNALELEEGDHEKNESEVVQNSGASAPRIERGRGQAAASGRGGGRTKMGNIVPRGDSKDFSIPKPSSFGSRNVILDEQDPMWAPTLTDEDLDADPPGHRSGYVAVIGKPNAGKSTLINAIVGQKLSIVSHKPQTTRHRIVGIASEKDYQMILFDTPGIIENKRNKLEERMMSAVVSSIQNSEAIIAVVDCSDHPEEALSMFQPGDDWKGPPMAVLLNKTDLMTPEKLSEVEDWYMKACKAEAVFKGSAMQNEGVKALKDWVVKKLPEGPTLYPKSVVSEQPERFFVAELIREQIFLLYSQEIPYSVQVHIKEFKERRQPKPLLRSLAASAASSKQTSQQSLLGSNETTAPQKAKDYISAAIMVEKESQVGILVGKNGVAMKKLGQQARVTIESFLERPVFLELSVEVSKSWRESKKELEKYGYFDSMYT